MKLRYTSEMSMATHHVSFFKWNASRSSAAAIGFRGITKYFSVSFFLSEQGWWVCASLAQWGQCPGALDCIGGLQASGYKLLKEVKYKASQCTQHKLTTRPLGVYSMSEPLVLWGLMGPWFSPECMHEALAVTRQSSWKAIKLMGCLVFAFTF